MKLIGINGSPRKKNNSAMLLESALQGAREAGAEVERIDLIDLPLFSGCKSCFACKRIGGKSFGRCALRDSLTPVLDRILAADALVISAPMYLAEVPGNVRCLLERLWYPSLMYRKDNTVAYERRYRVGMFYTMNLPDEHYYDELISRQKAYWEKFMGETHILCATDTLQFDEDYSHFTGDIFDGDAKRKRKETVFPQDCEKAREIGKLLVRE